jgi:SOS-response transcriptional repressor LexA
MTPKQRACLIAIDRLTVDGVPPSYENLRVALKLVSKSGVFRLINGLETQGYVRRLANTKRSIEIVRRPPWLDALAAAPAVKSDLAAEVARLIRVHGLPALAACVNGHLMGMAHD